MGKKIDLTGKRFGRLVVLREITERKRGNILWLCHCDCGNTYKVVAVDVIRKHTQSCGCKKAEKMKENIAKALAHNEKSEWKDSTSLQTLNSKLSKANKSGIKGVHLIVKSNKWRANITLQGKKHHLGCFSNLEDATKARKEAEEKYFKPILEKYGRDTESHELSVNKKETK